MTEARAPRLARMLPPVYGSAALRLAFPVLLLPLMAARLGAEAFGRMSLVLVWAGLLSTLVEGGFLAAVTRLAVRADAQGRRELAQQVFSARLVLSACTLVLAALAVAALWPDGSGAQRAGDGVLLAAIACALGWQATWYLQASEQLHHWAWVEMAIYGLWAGAVLAFGHSALAYLAMQAVASAVLAAGGWWWLRRDLRGGWPLWHAAAVRPGLRLAAPMLPVALAGAAYSYALPAVASAQMSRADLGLYYLADRLVRAVLAAADPVYQLVYPRIVRHFAGGLRAAWRYAARWAVAGALAGAVLWGAGALAWPLVGAAWASLRGGGFDPAAVAPVLAVLGLLLPLLMGWKFFGYWMLGSARLDRAYRFCMLAGGAAGVAGAALFAGGGALPLAWTAVGVELFVILCAVAGSALTLRGRAA